MNKSILGVGNAIVDVFCHVNEEFLKENNLVKGSMKLINKDEFNTLKEKIKIDKILAGGSAANTMAGISYLGGNASFIGKINSDEFGKLYKKSLEDINVKFNYIEKSEDLSTGASIILITPDSERTMCTYLGISSELSANDLHEEKILNKGLIFLEGYLWDKGISEKMFKHLIKLAKTKGIKIAMSLSDIFCVINLLKNDLDILIGNEKEIIELAGAKNIIDSINQLKTFNKLLVVTMSEKGSLAMINNEIINCEAHKVAKTLDLTGAGDLFAAGFLKEYVDQSEINKCLYSGSLIASKVIQKIGARLN
jgi:sugar/nucleoside kinase (ribokinase family)